MECKEVIDKIDSYLEGRLSDIEAHSIRKHLEKCQYCNEEYEEMKMLFSLMDNHEDIMIPESFTEEVMKKIQKQEKKKFIHISNGRWGISFLAAGILLALINLTSIDYSINEFAGDVFRGSFEINQRISNPFSGIFENFTGFSNGLWDK